MKSHFTPSMLKSKLIKFFFFERKEVRLLYISVTGFRSHTSPAIFVLILCLYYACIIPTMSLLCLLCLHYAYTMPTMPVLCLLCLNYACTMPVLCLLCLFITTQPGSSFLLFVFAQFLSGICLRVKADLFFWQNAVSFKSINI